MPNTPQPGRIATPVKLSGKTNSDPTEKVIENVTQHFGASEGNKRFRKAQKRVQATGTIPATPHYRITIVESGIVIFILFIIDVVEFFLGIFIVSEPADIVIGLFVGMILTIYCVLRLRMGLASHWQRYASIWGAFIAEDIPYLNIACFWTLDGIYIMHAIRNEDREAHARVVAETQAKQAEQDREEWVENYQQQQESSDGKIDRNDDIIN